MPFYVNFFLFGCFFILRALLQNSKQLQWKANVANIFNWCFSGVCLLKCLKHLNLFGSSCWHYLKELWFLHWEISFFSNAIFSCHSLELPHTLHWFIHTGSTCGLTKEKKNSNTTAKMMESIYFEHFDYVLITIQYILIAWSSGNFVKIAILRFDEKATFQKSFDEIVYCRKCRENEHSPFLICANAKCTKCEPI